MVSDTWAITWFTLLCQFAACSPAATEQPPTPVPTAPAPAISSAPPAPATPPASAQVQPPSAPPEGKLAAESLPAGLHPITEAEANEVTTRCKPLTAALGAAAKKNSTQSPYDFTVEFLKNPPKLKGVDVPRCADIVLRDFATRRAEMLESHASRHLMEIALSMKTAYDKQPAQLCPSAGPTPPELQSLEGKALPYRPEDWAAEGWKCVRFAPQPTVHYQYELKSDPQTLTYEVIARGYPVKGAPPSELYLRGKLGPGAPQAPGPVYRR